MMMISPSLLPSLIFRSVAPLIAYHRRIGGTRFDAGLDLQASRHSTIVVMWHGAGLDISLDLQGASRRLVVVQTTTSIRAISGDSGLNARFDFHTRLFLILERMRLLRFRRAPLSSDRCGARRWFHPP